MRLGIDFAFQHPFGAGDREAHDLAAQLIACAIALELDLRLGDGQGLLALETRSLARLVDDLVGTRLRLRFDRDGTARASLITSSARDLASDRSFWPCSAAASPEAIFFSRSFMAPRMIGQMNLITTQMKMANTSIWTMSVTVIFTRVSSTT